MLDGYTNLIDAIAPANIFKGNGGLKKTVREVQEKLKEYKFVFKSDVKFYLCSIDYKILLEQLAAKITYKTVSVD